MPEISMRVMSERGDFAKPVGFDYETVAVSQTAQKLGSVGAQGDYLHRLIIDVITAATATVTIIDGATSIVVATGGATVVPGTYSLELGIKAVSAATPGWSITTGAGATVLAVGLFS